jgi:hypothetical protein
MISVNLQNINRTQLGKSQPRFLSPVAAPSVCGPGVPTHAQDFKYTLYLQTDRGRARSAEPHTYCAILLSAIHAITSIRICSAFGNRPFFGLHRSHASPLNAYKH